jgi:hypothetical protein
MEKFEKEVQDYLTKVSQHTYKSGDRYMKVFSNGKKFMVFEWSNYHRKYVVREIKTDWIVKHYKGNAKCMLSHQLFLNKPTISGPKYMAVRQTKFVKGEIDKVMKELDL